MVSDRVVQMQLEGQRFLLWGSSTTYPAVTTPQLWTTVKGVQGIELEIQLAVGCGV